MCNTYELTDYIQAQHCSISHCNHTIWCQAVSGLEEASTAAEHTWVNCHMRVKRLPGCSGSNVSMNRHWGQSTTRLELTYRPTSQVAVSKSWSHL